METHVKVLGVLHVAMSAIGILFAILMMLIVGGAAGLAGVSGDPDARVAIPFIGITGMALVLFPLFPFIALYWLCDKTLDLLEWAFDDRWLTNKLDCYCERIWRWGMRYG